MYEVKLTEGEMRALVSKYDDLRGYLDECAKGYSVHPVNLASEAIEEAKAHVEGRVGYFMTKLDMGC